jgi:hypothetical protein
MPKAAEAALQSTFRPRPGKLVTLTSTSILDIDTVSQALF